MNRFLPFADALKNIGGEEIVLFILNHFAKIGVVRHVLAILFQFCPGAAKAYLTSELP
jgi:hypothetical protein